MRKIIKISAIVTILFFSLILEAGEWIKTGKLNDRRSEHKAVRLDNGKLLVAGGSQGTSKLASCEIYNPKTGEWSLTGSMNYARNDFSLVKLKSGKVIAIGGWNSSEPFKVERTCEIYNPKTEKWKIVDSLKYGRSHHKSILLENGKILTVGGTDDLSGDKRRASCEIYNPETNTWSLTDFLNEGRLEHTLTLLPSGKVLAAGDENSIICEIYNPETETWEITDSLTPAGNNIRSEGKAISLDNGKVIYISGNGRHITKDCNIFNPETEKWTLTDSLEIPRLVYTATLLPNGKVLVSGGVNTATMDYSIKSTEIYNPKTRKWHQGSDMNDIHYNHTSTLLDDGRVLTVGMVDQPEIYIWNYKPEIAISGPSKDTVEKELVFNIEVSDPNQDSVSIRTLWPDSDTTQWSEFETNKSVEIRKEFSKTGNYSLKVQAKDEWNSQDIHNSLSSWKTHSIEIVSNQPPSIEEISGPDSINTHETVSFEITASDPEDNDLSMRTSWSDSDTTQWSDFQSKNSFNVERTFDNVGNYTLKVQVKDTHDSLSSWKSHTVVVDTTTAIENGKNLPDQFRLYQNYPNPFNSSTTIEYDIAERSKVKISIYNITGKKIATLLDTEKEPGEYSIKWNPSNQATGVYFYRIKTETNTAVKKMSFIK